MVSAAPAPRFELYANPHATPDAPYSEALRSILSHAAAQEAWQEITGWPGYAPTPLRTLDGLAGALGLARVWYKDEGGRFGLGSFKALGGAYAVLRLLRAEVEARSGGRSVAAAELVGGGFHHLTREITVTCATDGNHGRSVAWGARLFGCRCVIYVHEHVSEGRCAAIAGYGAQVVRVPGTYDDAVHRAAHDAEANGWHVISDTSYPGYLEVPRAVMQGYSVMVAEAASQLPPGERPSHAFVQGGVGGLAAAVCAHLWEAWGAGRPRMVVVEPDKADCLYRTARAGRPTPVEGPLDTIMAGLAAGEVSLLAWEVLREGADFFMTLPDEAAAQAMCLLAEGPHGDAPIVAGESAVAGLAGLMAVLADPAAREAVGLEAGSRVLLIGSEGATDPETYRRIVGRAPQEVQP